MIMLLRILRKLFVAGFIVYKVPLFWNLPFLEQPAIRSMLLTMGMAIAYQTTLQNMLKQLDSMLEKAEDGLFIPLPKKTVLTQFTIIPVMTVIAITLLFSLILRSGYLKSIVVGSILAVLTIGIFYLEMTRKELMKRVYFAVSICILICSAIMINLSLG